MGELAYSTQSQSQKKVFMGLLVPCFLLFILISLLVVVLLIARPKKIATVLRFFFFFFFFFFSLSLFLVFSTFQKGMLVSRLAHGIMLVDSFADDSKFWRNEKKCIAKAFEKNKIQSVSRSGVRWLGLQHLLVVWSHERRYMNVLRSTFATFSRFIALHVSAIELCVVDEFFVEEKLVAFAVSVQKGSALRNLWFYCSKEASKFCIFPQCVLLGLHRARANDCKILDSGPSSESLRAAKEKFGFVFRSDYHDYYKGAYKVIKC